MVYRMLITRPTVAKDLLSLDHKSLYSVYLIIFLKKNKQLKSLPLVTTYLKLLSRLTVSLAWARYL